MRHANASFSTATISRSTAQCYQHAHNAFPDSKQQSAWQSTQCLSLCILDNMALIDHKVYARIDGIIISKVLKDVVWTNFMQFTNLKEYASV